jgi:hypothetical protein
MLTTIGSMPSISSDGWGKADGAVKLDDNSLIAGTRCLNDFLDTSAWLKLVRLLRYDSLRNSWAIPHRFFPIRCCIKDLLDLLSRECQTYLLTRAFSRPLKCSLCRECITMYALFYLSSRWLLTCSIDGVKLFLAESDRRSHDILFEMLHRRGARNGQHRA